MLGSKRPRARNAGAARHLRFLFPGARRGRSSRRAQQDGDQVIVVMRTGADRSEIEAVKQAIRDVGLEPYPVIGEERTVIAVVGI